MHVDAQVPISKKNLVTIGSDIYGKVVTQLYCSQENIGGAPMGETALLPIASGISGDMLYG